MRATKNAEYCITEAKSFQLCFPVGQAVSFKMLKIFDTSIVTKIMFRVINILMLFTRWFLSEIYIFKALFELQ